MIVISYLAMIVAANLLVARFGPAVSVVNALVFVGFDLVCRDRLHDAWHGRHLALRMGALIAAGSLLSWWLNRDAGRIAVASFAAFAAASVVDTVVYSVGMRRGWAWIKRSNASNAAGAAVDSLVFPTLAFGEVLPAIMIGQFAAKTVGGACWAWVLDWRRRKTASGFV